MQNAAEAWKSVTKPLSKSGSITAIFKQLGKGKVTYSHHMHMKTETKCITVSHTSEIEYWYMRARAEIVWLVSESLWPFKVIVDHRFLNGPAWILHTLCFHSVEGCQTGIFMDMGPNCKATSSKVSAHKYWMSNWSLTGVWGRHQLHNWSLDFSEPLCIVAVMAHFETQGQPIASV